MPRQFKHLRFCGGMIFNWDGEKQVCTPIPMCGREDCEVCTGSSVPKEKRYDWVPDGTGYGRFKNDEPPAGRLYAAEDFDRVTAERDAALGREAALIDQLDAALRQVKANWDYAQDKQQRLTAADERADLLEGLLRRAVGRIDDLADSLGNACEGFEGDDADDPQAEDECEEARQFCREARAALKPAEVPYAHSGEDDFGHRERDQW